MLSRFQRMIRNSWFSLFTDSVCSEIIQTITLHENEAINLWTNSYSHFLLIYCHTKNSTFFCKWNFIKLLYIVWKMIFLLVFFKYFYHQAFHFYYNVIDMYIYCYFKLHINMIYHILYDIRKWKYYLSVLFGRSFERRILNFGWT